MPDLYKKNYLKDVILRIDFPNTSLKLQDEVPISITKKILPHYPIPEKRDLIEKTVKISGSSDESPVEVIKEYTQWSFQSKNRDKAFCISNHYLYFDHKVWDCKSFKQVEEIFLSLLDDIFDLNPEIQITRLGLRYINHVKLDELDTPTDWSKYLNNKMLCIFYLADDKHAISRAFNNLELNYGEVRLKFQYGMHNPDYPAPIRKKLFILDYDAYSESLQDKKEIKANLNETHRRIIEFFEQSITEELRIIMRRE